MSDIEHQSEPTSSSNEQERLPETCRPVQSFWELQDGELVYGDVLPEQPTE